MKLFDLLNLKDFKYRLVVSARPDENLATVVRKLAEHDRGSLPVCNEQDELVGIITERDIVRKGFARGLDLLKTKVSDLMSKDILVATPDDTLDYAISVMKQKRIRHLPVVSGKKVIGMISMRDLLGIQLQEYTKEVRFLNDYIAQKLW